jgi:hypothetical protein
MMESVSGHACSLAAFVNRLSIFNYLIFDSGVDGAMPRPAAAPRVPL